MTVGETVMDAPVELLLQVKVPPVQPVADKVEDAPSQISAGDAVGEGTELILRNNMITRNYLTYEGQFSKNQMVHYLETI